MLFCFPLIIETLLSNSSIFRLSINDTLEPLTTMFTKLLKPSENSILAPSVHASSENSNSHIIV